MELFSMYHGSDWMQHVLYSPGLAPKTVVMYQSSSLKLLLSGWSPYQVLCQQNDYSMIHTKVLHGSLATSIQYPKHEHVIHRTLSPSMILTIPAFSKYTLSNKEQSVSLHLIQSTLF